MLKKKMINILPNDLLSKRMPKKHLPGNAFSCINKDFYFINNKYILQLNTNNKLIHSKKPLKSSIRKNKFKFYLKKFPLKLQQIVQLNMLERIHTHTHTIKYNPLDRQEGEKHRRTSGKSINHERSTRWICGSPF